LAGKVSTVHRDRPPVVPAGSANVALLGQDVEIPEDVVFTVESSARAAMPAAMPAAYELLGSDKPTPASTADRPVPRSLSDALTTAFG
jgi:oleate hydratase